MKQMKKLKRRLLEQIRSTGGVPPRHRDKTFSKEHEQYIQSKQSLKRIESAMAAWAGALDAFGACSQVLAEEMARHTMLVSKPTDPTKHGSVASDPTKFCRALQSLMSSVDRVYKPVHDVFLEGALRPLIEGHGADMREIEEAIEDRKRKFGLCCQNRRSSGGVWDFDKLNTENQDSNIGAVALQQSENGSVSSKKEVGSSMSSAKRERAENAERSLKESTEACLKKMERFRETRIKRIPQEIGVILGCHYELSNRFAGELSEFLPQFPEAACVMVDVATGSTYTKMRNEMRKQVKLENELALREEQHRRLARNLSLTSHGSGKSTTSTTRSGKWARHSTAVPSSPALGLHHHLVETGSGRDSPASINGDLVGRRAQVARSMPSGTIPKRFSFGIKRNSRNSLLGVACANAAADPGADIVVSSPTPLQRLCLSNVGPTVPLDQIAKKDAAPSNAPDQIIAGGDMETTPDAEENDENQCSPDLDDSCGFPVENTHLSVEGYQEDEEELYFQAGFGEDPDSQSEADLAVSEQWEQEEEATDLRTKEIQMDGGDLQPPPPLNLLRQLREEGLRRASTIEDSDDEDMASSSWSSSVHGICSGKSDALLLRKLSHASILLHDAGSVASPSVCSQANHGGRAEEDHGASAGAHTFVGFATLHEQFRN